MVLSVLEWLDMQKEGTSMNTSKLIKKLTQKGSNTYYFFKKMDQKPKYKTQNYKTDKLNSRFKF